MELACFVGERLGTFPDETGAFGFEWEQDGGEVDGEVNGAWVGGSDEDLLAEEDEVWWDIFFFISKEDEAWHGVCFLSRRIRQWSDLFF